jgi:DNA modification methylase
MTKTEFLDGRVTLHGGDCRDVLRDMPDASIDSVVTDPPYALVSIGKRFGAANAAPAQEGATGAYARASRGFMGKQWDTGEAAFAVEFWAQVWRVLKPGGHVVAFAGTRTYHRLACAIEDAGFEIRDQLAWCYGSGFPKSHDVSKGIDKAAGAGRGVVGTDKNFGKSRLADGKTTFGDYAGQWDITAPATDAARQWQGWGTALKPAWEPIVLARKPLDGPVAANVLAHGTGALNIDGCRVGDDVTTTVRNGDSGGNGAYGRDERVFKRDNPPGRWPANIVHDGSDEVVAAFPCAPGQQRAVGPQYGAKASVNVFGDYGPRDDFQPRNDSGSAARFFYSAKADKADRMGSGHPTVKPVDLMQWLCRLVTPPGSVVLDPFAGSGSTGEAAWREGFRAILIEREADYQADIAARLTLANAGPMARRARSIKQAEPGGLFANDNAPPEAPTVAEAPCATIDVVAFADSFPRTRSTPEQIAERRAIRFGKRFNAQRSAIRAIGPHAAEGVDFITTKAGDDWSWAPMESQHAA